jgi:cytochrome P450
MPSADPINRADHEASDETKRASALVPIRAVDAPRPRGTLILGNLLEAQRDPLGLFQRSLRDLGDHVGFRFGPFRYLLVNDPEGVRHILVDNNRNYRKSRSYEGLKLVLGQGLLTSEGDFWRRQRRLAQPAFHKERLASFAKMMVSDTSAMLQRWRGGDGGPFDVHHEMMRLTLRIVTRTLFSTDSETDADAVGSAIGVAIDYVNDYSDAVIRLPTWLPTRKNIRFRRAKRTLDSLVLRIVDERRRSGHDAGDLLSLLMSAKDEDTREQMTDRQLRDEVMTIVLAGHETTANALTWAFYLLSKHPAAAQRLRREIEEVLGGRTPSIEDLPRLTYARMVIEETLRLYPPAWVLEREAIQDDAIGGYRVPKKTIVAVAPYSLHRHPRYWQNPEDFDPERFTPARAAERPKYAYLPFGAGPRLCIGNGFAMMEAQIILAMVMGDCALQLVPNFKVELVPSITLRPRSGVLMTRVAVATEPPPAAPQLVAGLRR